MIIPSSTHHPLISSQPLSNKGYRTSSPMFSQHPKSKMLSFMLLSLLLFSSLVVSFPSQHSPRDSDGANRRPHSYQQRNLDTITKIYERNVYPTNLQFITNGSSSVPAGLFSENATGRITPLGNFTGFQESTEYFFALSPVPQPPTYGGFSKIQIVEFQSQCANVASSVVYITESVIHPGAPNDGQLISTLKQACVSFIPALEKIKKIFFPFGSLTTSTDRILGV